jgi:hypothetical protein
MENAEEIKVNDDQDQQKDNEDEHEQQNQQSEQENAKVSFKIFTLKMVCFGNIS